MKTGTIHFPNAGFFAGLLCGVSLFAFYAFTDGSPAPGDGDTMAPVTVETARGYILNYQADAAVLNVPVKGFVVDRSQLQAMNALVAANDALAGFRIYLGRKDATRKVALVVGMDAAGKDAVKQTIYSTDASQAGPCPTVCDVASPLAGEK